LKLYQNLLLPRAVLDIKRVLIASQPRAAFLALLLVSTAYDVTSADIWSNILPHTKKFYVNILGKSIP